MRFFKNYPYFCTTAIILLIVFLVGLYLMYAGYRNTVQEERKLRSTEDQLRVLLAAHPAPTLENLELSESNIAVLNEQLTTLVRNIEGRSEQMLGANVPTEGFDLVILLSGFVFNSTTKFKDAGVRIPNNFTFGFGEYSSPGATPPPPAAIPTVYRQYEIIDYLLDQLLESFRDTPDSALLAVEREAAIAPAPVAGKPPAQPREIFTINPLVTARVDNAIETLAFRIRFASYTEGLREFLKRLAEFELPLVVRSVEVQPYRGRTTSPTSKPTAANTPFASLGFLNAESNAEETGPEEGGRGEPLISETLSEFTVVIEFIDVLLETPGDIAAIEAAGTEKPSTF